MSDVEKIVREGRELLSSITPGPWGWDGDSYMGAGEVFTFAEQFGAAPIAGPTGDCYPRSGYSPKEDMQFIAAAPAKMAELLDIVENQSAEIARLRSMLTEGGVQ